MISGMSDFSRKVLIGVGVAVIVFVGLWMPFARWRMAEARLQVHRHARQELAKLGNDYQRERQQLAHLQQGAFPAGEDPALGLRGIAEEAGLAGRIGRLTARSITLPAPYSGLEIEMALEKVQPDGVRAFLNRLAGYPAAYNMQRFQMRRRYDPAQGYDATVTVFARTVQTTPSPSSHAPAVH